MTRCRFETDLRYYDEKTGDLVQYECDALEEDILESGLCIFHDQKYLTDPKNRKVNALNLKRKLAEKVKKNISGNEPLICIGYRLPVISFEHRRFDKSVYFSGARFTKEANFSRAQFIERADFSKAQFTERAYFPEAQFTKEADFSEAQFTKEAYFSGAQSGAQFTKEAYFSGAQFTKEANFWNALFTEEADFTGEQVMRAANVWGAQFTKEANFSRAQFIERADFSKAQFTERAYFPKAQFTERVDFSGAQFTKEANFWNALFTEEADFTGSQFTERAYFPEAQFTKEAYFSRAQFTKEAYFWNALFTKEADFWYAQFHGASDYGKSKFINGAEFSHSKFIQEATFADTIFASRSNFNYVLFRDPENTIFQTDKLSNVSFLNTDISRVRFGENVKWGLINKPSRRNLKEWWHGDKNEFKILEEREIETALESKKKLQDILLGSVLAVYRNLRENYEYRMRYDEAGEFFIREMEMKRKYREVSLKKKKESPKNRTSLEKKNDEVIVEIRQNNWIIRNFSLTALYYHLSRYGQSISRPVLFGIAIVLFSTLLWLTQQDPAARDYSITNVTLPIVNNSNKLAIAFERSLTNFLPNLSFGTETGAGLLDFAFKIVGGAVTFGLIIIALRRKFERKFRH
jgi:uncharacterized protein YjbI with pentapeptide repeats